MKVELFWNEDVYERINAPEKRYENDNTRLTVNELRRKKLGR